MKRALIYTRVSSERQIDGYSLDSQEDLCRKYAERHDFEVVKVYREEGISGKTTKRPQLQSMLSYAKNRANGIITIFVYSFSRLNRNALDYLMIRNDLSKYAISLISITEPSGDSPAEKMIGTILAGFNQYQNEERAQNVANSLKRRFFDGHITVKPPIGYLMEKVNGKSIAVKDPIWFPIIQNLWFRVRDERLSLQQVTNILNATGLRTTHDRRFKKFQRQSIAKMFSSKFYMGILVSEKYGETIGKHDPMIDENTYYVVRDIIAQKRTNTKERYTKQREDFPLRGILRCPYCSRKLTAGVTKGKYSKYPYYLCYSRKEHKNYNIQQDTLHKKFYALLDRMTMTVEFMKWLAEMVIEKYEAEVKVLTTSEDTVHRDIAELEDIKKTIGIKNAKGLYSDDEYLAMKEDINSQLMVKKGIISEKQMDTLDIQTTVRFIKYYFTHLRDSWERATLEGKYAIESSMFPNGLVFEDEEFRTPLLGRGYALTQEAYTSVSNRVIPQRFEL